MSDNEELELGQFARVPLDVDVELERRTLTIREILDLKVGAVLVLKRPAGENFDVLIGGARVGSGEAVMIENTMAVRLTGFED